MPVGNSDRGVGLGAGEVMVFADFSYQNFDWWHEKIDDAYIPGTNELEYFDHKGLFNNNSLNLGFTIGINDYWNITVSQLISERCMEWEGEVFTGDEAYFDPSTHTIGDSKTVHHRSECTSSNFINNEKTIAYGGYLGDTKINFKYLVYNQGKGPGNRLFLGGGFIVPSTSTLSESPWEKKDIQLPNGADVNTYSPHRHFYLSDGAYKMYTEIQFFNKRIKEPAFLGGTFSYTFPLNESKFNFKPSDYYELSFILLSGPLKIKTPHLQISLGFNFTMAYSGASSWDGVRTPNSEAILYIPGFNLTFGTKSGVFGLNLSAGYEEYLQVKETDIEETNKIFAITLSYRKVLDKVIEKLYWK